MRLPPKSESVFVRAAREEKLKGPSYSFARVQDFCGNIILQPACRLCRFDALKYSTESDLDYPLPAVLMESTE